MLGVGKATRLLRFLTGLPKTYVGEIVLGTETDTLDAVGEVTATHDMSAVTPSAVRAASVKLTGLIEQVPPMVSAVMVDGKRLHQLAREGKTVERKARPVTVHRFDVEPLPDEPGVWRCEVECSSGTYVRALAADLGTALGGGAHLRALRRTAVGGFTVDDAATIETPSLRPVVDAVRHLPTVVADDDLVRDVAHGKVVDRGRLGVDGDGPWAVVDAGGTLLAVYEPHKGVTKPSVVIPR